MINILKKPAAIMTTGNLYLNYEKKKVSMKNPLALTGLRGIIKNINNL